MASTERARRYEEVAGVMTVAAIGQHAVTHGAGGSDPLNIHNLGGITRPEILEMIRSSQQNCFGIPDGVEILINKGAKNGYCPLGPNKKVPLEYLPAIFSIPRVYSVEGLLPGTVLPHTVGGTYFERGIIIPVNSSVAMSKSSTIPYVSASVKTLDSVNIIIRIYIRVYESLVYQPLCRYAGLTSDDAFDITIKPGNHTSDVVIGQKSTDYIDIDEGDELALQVVSCGTISEFLKVRIFARERI